MTETLAHLAQYGDILNRVSINVHHQIKHLGVGIGWSSLSSNSSSDHLVHCDGLGLTARPNGSRQLDSGRRYCGTSLLELAWISLPPRTESDGPP